MTSIKMSHTDAVRRRKMIHLKQQRTQITGKRMHDEQRVRRRVLIMLLIMLTPGILAMEAHSLDRSVDQQSVDESSSACGRLFDGRPSMRSFCLQMTTHETSKTSVPPPDLTNVVADLLPGFRINDDQTAGPARTNALRLWHTNKRAPTGRASRRMLLDPALESMASRSHSEALSSFLMGDSNNLETDGKFGGGGEAGEGSSVSNRWQPMRGKRAFGRQGRGNGRDLSLELDFS